MFMFAEPLAAWRQVSVRTKTKVDWAIEMGMLLRQLRKVIVVCDNPSTHTIDAFYKVFEPTHARTLVSRLEFHKTPKHDSWLNIAGNERSCLTSQCQRSSNPQRGQTSRTNHCVVRRHQLNRARC